MTSLSTIPIHVKGEDLILHPYRAIHWPKQNLLIVSDLHLGKVSHFRQAGVFVPADASMDNYERLSSLLLEFQPQTLLILGDLFHSDYNHDWRYFSDLRQTFHHIRFELVLGNHDILDEELFLMNDVIVHNASINLAPFIFSHHPLEEPFPLYNLAGHVHPGVRLVGDSKQSLRFPCFYFGQRQGILPAFGAFTGIFLLYPREEDQVVIITEEGLMTVSQNVASEE